MLTFPTELNIDIDSLFKMSFNYNFDVLKIAIEGLLRNQKGMYRNMHELKVKNKNKDLLITKYIQHHITLLLYSLIKKLKEENLLKDFEEKEFENKLQDQDQKKESDLMETFEDNNQDYYYCSNKSSSTESNII